MTVNKQTIMIVTAEFRPLVKTGGLADMTRAIAEELVDSGSRVRILIPGFRSVLEALGPLAEPGHKMRIFDYDVELAATNFERFEIVVVLCDQLFNREGSPYRDANGQEWPDMVRGFGVLCFAAAAIVNGKTPIPRPTLLHLHDWHSALTPAFLESTCDIPVVLTVHNFMFQGRASTSEASYLRIALAIQKNASFFDGISFLQVGLRLANVILTVSPGYVQEIQRPNRHNWWYVKSSEDRARLAAILNWPDLSAWHPEDDPAIAASFDFSRLESRRENRRALERQLGWKEEGPAILCTVSRITGPKGFSFLARRVRELMARDCRLVITGDGDARLLNRFRNLSSEYPNRIALLCPYHEEEARRILAGADALIMPSLTEPCGLSQQQAQVYGCIPIVSSVGGLPDTVEEGVTGFLFEASSPVSFFKVVDECLRLMNSDRWVALQTACMRRRQTDQFHYARLFDALHSKTTTLLS